MSLKATSKYGDWIKSKSMTSSLSGEGSPLKVGFLFFGSPVSASAVSEPIFEMKDAGYNNKVQQLKKEKGQ